MKIKFILLTLFLSSCMTSKSSNAIEELSDSVLKRKEGIIIQLTPVEEDINQKK